MIFLDYNSTTPVREEVMQAMLPWFSKQFANEASNTHVPGWQARKAVEMAREEMASLLVCDEQEIIFTSGATESAWIALYGLWKTHHASRNEILVSATEHSAVINAAAALAERGAILRTIPCNHHGAINMEFLSEAVSDKTLAVIVMHANNETGNIHPASTIASIAHQAGAFYVCDASQSAGKISCTIEETGADLLFFSAHKFYGPKGIGILFARRKNPRVQLAAIMPGHGHERGLRQGTLNVPAIVGMQKAFSLSHAESWDHAAHTSRLRTYLEQYLELHAGARINGDMRNRLPNTTNLLFAGKKASQLIKHTPELAFSTGSACTSAMPAPSHVLLAMGLSEADAYASARFSLSYLNTMDEIDSAAKMITHACSLS
ncbi:MAG: cysteine desulfurase family protein [Bacteroidota bacterium]|jgi:cysteine desulfurase